MTIILQPTRAFSQHLLPRSHQLLARVTFSANFNLRVKHKQNSVSSDLNHSHHSSSTSFLAAACRSYATAASKLGKPKGHTGRGPAKRTSTTTKSVASTKGGKKPAAAKKAKAKPKAKKAKPKAKPKPKKPKVISKTAQKRIDTQAAKALKEKALLHPPKKLPETAWSLLFAGAAPKGTQATGESAKAAAQTYKNLSPEERERYNHTAVENKKKNEIEFKKWLSNYTPMQIKEANNARNMLRRQAKKSGKKTAYAHLQDDRQVKLARTPYAYFVQARVASGDMKNMKISEIGGLVAREWKGLSSAEKKTYEEMGLRDKNRYREEHKSVYGVDAPFAKLEAKAAA